jgi:hypothetical protein
MSKARLVITAVVIEGRSQGEVARAYGVSQGWVSRLVARYQAEGEAAFEPRSRRPKTSPMAISDDTVEEPFRCLATSQHRDGGIRTRGRPLPNQPHPDKPGQCVRARLRRGLPGLHSPPGRARPPPDDIRRPLRSRGIRQSDDPTVEPHSW